MTYAQSPLRNTSPHTLTCSQYDSIERVFGFFFFSFVSESAFPFPSLSAGLSRVPRLSFFFFFFFFFFCFSESPSASASGAAAVVCVFSPRAASAGARGSFAGPEVRDSFSFFVCFPFPGLPFAVCVSSKNP